MTKQDVDKMCTHFGHQRRTTRRLGDLGWKVSRRKGDGWNRWTGSYGVGTVDMTQDSLVHKRAITANTKRQMRLLVTMHWRCWKRTQSGAQRSAGIIATDQRTPAFGVEPARNKKGRRPEENGNNKTEGGEA